MTDCPGWTAPIPVAASVSEWIVAGGNRISSACWRSQQLRRTGSTRSFDKKMNTAIAIIRMRLGFCALSLLLCLAFSVARAAASSPRAPNIVILLADDLGRADLGYAGSEIKTPNIDRLVTTGVRLDRFYACPVCSPTRAGLLTGRWPIRHGIMRTVIPPWSTHGLPLEERTLADALREAGYARRGVFGKWHLGHAKRAFLPPQRGFTHFYGHYNGALDYFTHVREGEVDWHRDNETVKEEGYATDLIAREAVRFVEEAPVSSPFFLYVPFNAPHSPFQAKPDDLARYPNRQGNK